MKCNKCFVIIFIEVGSHFSWMSGEKGMKTHFVENNKFVMSTNWIEICWQNRWNLDDFTENFDTSILSLHSSSDQSKSLRCFNDCKLVMQHRYINTNITAFLLFSIFRCHEGKSLIEKISYQKILLGNHRCDSKASYLCYQ